MLKRIWSFLVVVILLITVTMSAQITTASMSGEVTARDKPIIGATIVAIHEPSGTRYGTVANINGQFNLQGMRTDGPYKIKIIYVGYQSVIYKGIQLSLGGNCMLNVSLKESSELLGEVVVTAPKTIEKIGTVANVSERQMNTLPTINRNITDFTRFSSYAGGSNSFAGRDRRYNNITIDGTSLNSSFGLSSNNLPGGDPQPISLDAIDEIAVNASPYDVKYSNLTGASINAVTKSGTNSSSGAVYTYHKPRGFVGSSTDGEDILKAKEYNSHSYGVTLGGPIIKNKLFFFLDVETENKETPGVTWLPNQDQNGTGDSGKRISHTQVGDVCTVNDSVKTKYDYDPGQYENFNNFQNDSWKLVVRIDWSIHQSHKLTMHFNSVSSEDGGKVSTKSAIITSTNSNRYGLDAFSFGSSNYKMENVITSITGELGSHFSDSVQNGLLATYTHTSDIRGQKGSDFPFVDIYKDRKQYIALGTKVFTPNNQVINNVFSLVDNVSISLGKRKLLAGVSLERQYFKNSYLRGSYGYHRYDSVDDFMRGKVPTIYGITYGYSGNDTLSPELTFGMAGMYARDVWPLTPNFRLTYGLRLDMPICMNSLDSSKSIGELAFVNNIHVDISRWPKAQVLFSPRVSFSWDVRGDRSVVVSGGTGVFTGLLPFVWFINQPSNSDLYRDMVEYNTQKNPGSLPADSGFNPNYKETLQRYSSLLPSTPPEQTPDVIAYVDPKFKVSQIWRGNLNMDTRLPYDFILSIGAVYARDTYNVAQINMNEAEPAGVYNEQPDHIYWASKKYEYNGYTNGKNVVIKLSNGGDKGCQYSFNAILTKKYGFGFIGSIGYTYTCFSHTPPSPRDVS